MLKLETERCGIDRVAPVLFHTMLMGVSFELLGKGTGVQILG